MTSPQRNEALPPLPEPFMDLMNIAPERYQQWADQMRAYARAALAASPAAQGELRMMECPGCGMEFADGALHDANLELHRLRTAQPSTQPEPMSDERITDLVTDWFNDGGSGQRRATILARTVESATADAWRSHLAAMDAEVAALRKDAERWQMHLTLARRKHAPHIINQLVEAVDAAIDRAGGGKGGNDQG